MPKDTFYNLSKEKQSLIFNISVKEFYEKGYDLTSISSIVERAQIAKGSFYQYFENKDDLFKYILTTTNDKKMDFVYPVILAFDELSFFDWFKNMLLSSFVFLKSYPDLAKISEHFWKHSNPVLKEKIMGGEVKRTQAFIETFIEKAIERNELTQNISKSFLASFFANHLAYFSDYLTEMFDDLLNVPQDELIKVIDDFVYVIKSGVQKHTL